MAFLTAIGMGVGAVGAGVQFFQGSALKRAADRQLSQFQHQELTNLAENLKPSLEAEKQAVAAADKSRAMFADVAGGMDAASAMALLSQGQQQVAGMEQQAFASVLEKEYQADVQRVAEEQNIRGMIEKRKMEELQSLKAQKMAGMQMQQSAIKDLASMAVSSGTARDMALARDGKTPKTFGDGIKDD